MIKKRMLIIFLSMIIMNYSIAVPISAGGNIYSWYCKRNGTSQPPLPSEFSFINNYSVIWMNTCRSDEDERKIAYLTFDAGYENGNVEKILNILKEKDAVGAFFILVNLIESNPDLVKRMQNEGHYVCNHTAHHKDMSKINDIGSFEKELTELNDSYKEITGTELRPYYRPPEGKFSEQNLKFADSLGYHTVFWSFAYADWDNNNQPSPEYAKQKILDNMHNGCVLLLHPTSTVNVQILGDIIDSMRNEGYEFGTLGDLYNEVQK